MGTIRKIKRHGIPKDGWVFDKFKSMQAFNRKRRDLGNIIVTGIGCTWWDTINKAATNSMNLPCCPHCGSLLYQYDDEATWWNTVAKYELDHPEKAGYCKFTNWVRGKCFTKFDDAMAAYKEESAKGPESLR